MIQKYIVKRAKRTIFHKIFRRFFYAKEDEKAVAAWRLDLDGILRVFNVRPLTRVQ